jgi:hypothetical protein
MNELSETKRMLEEKIKRIQDLDLLITSVGNKYEMEKKKSNK